MKIILFFSLFFSLSLFAQDKYGFFERVNWWQVESYIEAQGMGYINGHFYRLSMRDEVEEISKVQRSFNYAGFSTSLPFVVGRVFYQRRPGLISGSVCLISGAIIVMDKSLQGKI